MNEEKKHTIDAVEEYSQELKLSHIENGIDLETFEYKESGDFKNFPTNIFPEKIENLIDVLYRNVGFEKSVSASAMLFAVSTIIGNSKQIKVKNTWIDPPNLWIAIVGKRGTMKTPTIKFPLLPLQGDEVGYAEEFEKELASWNRLEKEEQQHQDKPTRKQRITTDITAEGMVKLLKENPNGIGIVKDELNGLFKEMSRYNSAGVLEFLLSAYSGGQFIKNRATQDSTTIDNIFLSIIGTIQPQVLKQMANTNTDNGFIDRWLYVKSENKIPDFDINQDIDIALIESYNSFIRRIKDQAISQEQMTWAPKSKAEFQDCINKIRHIMKHDDTSDQLSAYLAKIETYFARFCTLIAIMDMDILIEKKHVQKAFMLAKFYIWTAENTFIGFENEEEINAIYKTASATTKKQKVIALHKNLPKMTHKQIAEEIGCNKSFVQRTIKNIPPDQDIKIPL
jgi:3-methyladenine DNA glycosylase Tag